MQKARRAGKGAQDAEGMWRTKKASGRSVSCCRVSESAVSKSSDALTATCCGRRTRSCGIRFGRGTFVRTEARGMVPYGLWIRCSQRWRTRRSRRSRLWRCACGPVRWNELVGQQEAVGPGSWLRNAIEQDKLELGDPVRAGGHGQDLARRTSSPRSTKAAFVEVSAVGGTVSDLRREIDAAEKRLSMSGLRTILFVDEIHRFNRSQQDALLHAVEDRILVLVGATTENPFFEVNSALDIALARGRGLHALSDEDLSTLIDRARRRRAGLGGLVRARRRGAQRDRPHGGRRRTRSPHHAGAWLPAWWSPARRTRPPC